MLHMQEMQKYARVIENYDNVSIFTGLGKFVDKKTIMVSDSDGNEVAKVSGSNVLIATGSHPTIPNIKGLRETGFLTSGTVWEKKGSAGIGCHHRRRCYWPGIGTGTAAFWI